MHAWIWMKCCMSTDVGTWTNCLTFVPDPDYSPAARTGLLSPISYKRWNAEFYYVRKIPRIRIGRPSLQRGVVLFTATRRNTFVGGTCALPSTVLVADWSVLFICAVPARIHDLRNITQNENIAATLSCRSYGDPAPKMKFRKIGSMHEFNASNVRT